MPDKHGRAGRAVVGGHRVWDRQHAPMNGMLVMAPCGGAVSVPHPPRFVLTAATGLIAV